MENSKTYLLNKIINNEKLVLINLGHLEADSIAKDNLMAEMNEAILGAMGTFAAIARGVLTTESNPVTGEPLTQIAKEQAEELRKIFDKYCELTK